MAISLTAGMRSNLTNLQSTAKMMEQTSLRLNTGKKVNSALDDPISYFTAREHASRASELGTLKNGMSEGIQTITAANNGIESIISLIQDAKSKAESAKSVESSAGSQYTTSKLDLSGVVAGDTITIGGVSFEATTVASTGTSFQVGATDELTAYNLANLVTSSITSTIDVSSISGSTISFENSVADMDADDILFTDTAAFNESLTAGTGTSEFDIGTVNLDGVVAGDTITIGGVSFEATTVASTGTSFQVGDSDEITAYNLANLVTSSSTSTMDVSSISGSTISFENSVADVVDADISTTDSTFTETVQRPTDSVGSESELGSLMRQFSTLMSQIEQLQSNSGYKGINLLDSDDSLTVKFEGSNKLEVVGFDGSLSGLGLYDKAGAGSNDWSSDALIDADIARLDAAVAKLESKAGDLASSLSIVTTRQDFTENMINTLTTGADNLTLADMNEEGANMLMLQTQQTLGTTSLSMSAQTAQGVLRLF